MEKMTSREFSSAMDKFLRILECQPHLVSTRHGGTAAGEDLAEMAVAFIDRIHKLRGERIVGGMDQ